MEGVVPIQTGLAAHVSQGIDLHHQRHKSDQAQHAQGKGVDNHTQDQLHPLVHIILNARRPGLEPNPLILAGQHAGLPAGIAIFRGGVGRQPTQEHPAEQAKPGGDSQDGQEGTLTGQILAEEDNKGYCRQAEKRN